MEKSIFLGYDENGREIFNNTRTYIGELIYKYKYKNEKNCLLEIVKVIKEFLESLNLVDKFDVIVPVPPTNKNRKYQPVFEIAKEIAKCYNKECKLNALHNESNFQVKNGYDIKGKIKQTNKIEKISNIIVIDDLYSTGKTLNEVCKVLKRDNNVRNIYCLVMTKTKR